MNVELHLLSEALFQDYFPPLQQSHALDIARTDYLPPEKAKEVADRKTAKLLPQGRTTPHHHFFQVLHNGKDVGRAWLHVDPDQEMAWLYHITIHAEFRRQGLGRKTLMALFQRSKELGGRVFWLNVFEDNPGARSLYESMGFRTVTRHMNLSLS